MHRLVILPSGLFVITKQKFFDDTEERVLSEAKLKSK